MRFAVVVALAVAAGGCADGPFKRAVSAWAGSHMKPYARYVITDSAYASKRPIDARELMTVAGVQCLVDEGRAREHARTEVTGLQVRAPDLSRAPRRGLPGVGVRHRRDAEGP